MKGDLKITRVRVGAGGGWIDGDRLQSVPTVLELVLASMSVSIGDRLQSVAADNYSYSFSFSDSDSGSGSALQTPTSQI